MELDCDGRLLPSLFLFVWFVREHLRFHTLFSLTYHIEPTNIYYDILTIESEIDCSVTTNANHSKHVPLLLFQVDAIKALS